MLRNILSPYSCSQLKSSGNRLAELRFGVPAHNGSTTDQSPNMHVRELPESVSHELWLTDQDDVEIGQHGACFWRRDKDFQFTTINLPLAAGDDYEQAAQYAYKEILNTIKISPADKLVRFWNYVPLINDGEGDAEHYKEFCTGRLRAFTQHGIDYDQFPAASAVGHHQSGLAVCAITCTNKAKHHANPRQVDAFEYPREYGPSSPSFARASTLETDDAQYCFISGTASILGHSTVHEGDFKLQLHTTNDNILYLLEETGFSIEQVQTLRVYLRNDADLEECQRDVAAHYPNCELVFAEADICRRELLVEIEAFCAAKKN